MLKYLIIPLATDAVSFCHYKRNDISADTIGPDMLMKAIIWAMKGNLNIQFLFPDNTVSDEYKDIIESIDHTSIVSASCEDSELIKVADIVVFDTWTAINHYEFQKDKSYVIRTSKDDFFENARFLKNILEGVDRLVIVFTDPESFSDKDFEQYSMVLDSLCSTIVAEYKKNHLVHFNLLTDRLFLDKMNNCNAGDESITLAPDGKFYICPAFYLDGGESVGNLEDGLVINNSQLYHLDHAPICRICDAYQCRRCIWLNKKKTLEVNTPSREQCIIAHIERNASKKLKEKIREHGILIPLNEIKQIDYLDPFEKLTNV